MIGVIENPKGTAGRLRALKDYKIAAKSGTVELVSTETKEDYHCLLYTSPSPRDGLLSRMPSSA